MSLDERDNDPKVLLTYVAEALNAVEPIGQRVFDELASPGSSVPDAIVPALGFGFSSMTNRWCWSWTTCTCYTTLIAGSHCRFWPTTCPPARGSCWPGGTLCAPLRAAARRSRILEVGPRDLALTHEEASSLLRNAGVSVSEDDVAELHWQAEGWPAGLYLAALRLKEGGQVATEADAFRGDDRLVSEYMESEFLARLSPRQRVFLTRTAVLERLCGPLCEDVLDQPGAAATLADLARSNLLLVPLDAQGEWYRYHHLFRDMLLAELRRQEPELIPVLRRRAAGWCARNGLPEEALEYSIATGDVDAAAGLPEGWGVRAYRQGKIAAVQRWLRWLEDRGEAQGHPMVAVMAGLLSAVTGRAAEAERWADVVDHWQYGEASGPERSCRRSVGRPVARCLVPARGQADACRRRRGRAPLRGRERPGAGRRAHARGRPGPVW